MKCTYDNIEEVESEVSIKLLSFGMKESTLGFEYTVYILTDLLIQKPPILPKLSVLYRDCAKYHGVSDSSVYDAIRKLTIEWDRTMHNTAVFKAICGNCPRNNRGYMASLYHHLRRVILSKNF